MKVMEYIVLSLFFCIVLRLYSETTDSKYIHLSDIAPIVKNDKNNDVFIFYPATMPLFVNGYYEAAAKVQRTSSRPLPTYGNLLLNGLSGKKFNIGFKERFIIIEENKEGGFILKEVGSDFIIVENIKNQAKEAYPLGAIIYKIR